MRIKTLPWKPFGKDFAAFAVIFAALVLRMSYFGFEYYLQLDDYIHFRDFPAGTDFIQLCIDGGYFASRPFAILSDFWIWGRLPSYLSALIIAFFYALSGVLFLKLFRSYFSTGWFFVVFYALLPLGFEGTYWLAASTRIVPPLLFTALALLAFDAFCETKKGRYLIPYLLCALASYTLYEQMLVLSLALCLMIMLLQLLRKRWHALWGLLVFVPVGIYFGFTGYFANSEAGVGKRMNWILPTDPSYFTTFLPSLRRQLYDAFVKGGIMTLCKGFVRGVKLIFTEGIWSAVLIPVLGLGSYWVGKRCQTQEKGSQFHLAPLFGVLGALAPVTIFFVIANPWFSLRNTAASFLGLALLADYLLRLICKNKTAVLSAVFACVCLVASVSELYDYKMTTEYNEKVAQLILQADAQYDLEGNVGILGLNASFLTDQNFQFHDHVIGTQSSDWALKGAMRYLSGETPDFTPCPVSTDSDYLWDKWNRSAKDITQYDRLFYYNHEAGTLALLTIENDEGELLLYDPDGVLCARIWEDDGGYGRMELYD